MKLDQACMMLAPVASMFCCIATVVKCYTLWYPTRQDKSLYFPAISEMGVAQPQKFYYQLGFGLTGFFLACHIKVFESIVGPYLKRAENEERSLDSCVRNGLIAAFGCSL